MRANKHAPGEVARAGSDGWDAEFICKDDPHASIPPGKYMAQVVRCERKPFLHNLKRAYVWVEIVDPGAYFGTQLFMSINTGYEKFSRGTKLVKMASIALNRPIRRNERIALKVFQNKIFVVEVDYADSHPRYSVVTRLVALAAGGQP